MERLIDIFNVEWVVEVIFERIYLDIIENDDIVGIRYNDSSLALEKIAEIHCIVGHPYFMGPTISIS